MSSTARAPRPCCKLARPPAHPLCHPFLAAPTRCYRPTCQAAPAAKKASPAKAAASASKEAEEEEAEEEEEDDEGEDEDEDEDEDGAKPAKALSLKQAGKAPAKGKGAKVVGTTAAQIKYHAYDPIRGATWKPGEPVPYIFLARVFGTIEETSKRLIITERMANAFRSVIATSPKELLSLTCLATNKLAPAYMGIELGIGDSIMIKAVSETCGRSVAAIKDQLEVDGDLGCTFPVPSLYLP